ncbi:hypothetical protein [Klebsiella grimontii]|uniref:hypothetical protein n=1 Tax=Klebsiella grimontii TaxID=2058152 RepID=UPI001DA0F9F5|nr:hypothetical protein [Klebsiella grimontii]EGT0068870.1 hypothetical protein [Klebsiella michiganensis]WDI71271.1 hypothetical protein PU992_06040 [Klebsiella grimontii]
MNVYEMEGFLRGKCLPGDLKVNESNAEYLVRKLNAVSELKGELTAALATIEKCREIVGCPAGVDLQDWVKKLAAENLAIKAMNDCLSEELRGYESDGVFEGPKMHLLWWQVETPATDRIVAEAEARGVDKFAKKLESRGRHQDYVEIANAFAKQLREEDK